MVDPSERSKSNDCYGGITASQKRGSTGKSFIVKSLYLHLLTTDGRIRLQRLRRAPPRR